MTFEIPEFISIPHLILCGDEAEGIWISYLTETPSNQQVTNQRNVKKLKNKLNSLAQKHGPSSLVMTILWALMLISISAFLLILYMSLSFIYLLLPILVYTTIPPLIKTYRRSVSAAVFETWQSALPEINLSSQKDGYFVLIFREEHKGVYHGLYNYRVYVAEANTPLPLYQASEVTVPPPVYRSVDMLV